MTTKTKIVLDADVIIHFIKAEQFSLLIDIFPEYEYLILDVVYNEVTVNHATKIQIDNTLKFFSKRISNVKFAPQGASRMEYAKLLSTLGRGESACMVYCRDNKDVLGSSNLRDIKEYCTRYKITYLTTLDFLYYAFVRGKLSKEECDKFIHDVIAKGSKLPIVDITTYSPMGLYGL
jgi:predicted nucleic acid-binding protein